MTIEGTRWSFWRGRLSLPTDNSVRAIGPKIVLKHANYTDRLAAARNYYVFLHRGQQRTYCAEHETAIRAKFMRPITLR